MVKRPAIVDALVFVGLFVAGAGLRLQLQGWPNVAPVAAISLFAGYYFRSWLVAATLPLAIMGASDYFIGGYDLKTMMLVHGALALPMLFGLLVRRWHTSGKQNSIVRYVAGALCGSLASSCLFFLVSNLGTWLWSGMYDQTFAGMARCYFNALPYFRSTLGGDLFFTTVLFGSFGALTQIRLVWDRSVVPEKS